jgi:hypothetical protein
VYLDNIKSFWQEVELRAKNNYGPVETGEEVEVSINQAIQELADEMKNSQQAIETKHSILVDMGLEA